MCTLNPYVTTVDHLNIALKWRTSEINDRRDYNEIQFLGT